MRLDALHTAAQVKWTGVGWKDEAAHRLCSEIKDLRDALHEIWYVSAGDIYPPQALIAAREGSTIPYLS